MAGQQSGLKGAVPILSCPHQLMGLTIWDLGACSDQRNSWGWFLATQNCAWSRVLAQDMLALDSRKH